MTTDEIRAGLRNIKTRSVTIDAVADKGADIIDSIIPLLQDRHEGVRWSVINIISEIGGTSAIGPLITLLEQGKNTFDAANALRKITGQAFDDSADDWRKWAMTNEVVRNSAGSPVLSDKDLILEATRDLPATATGKDQSYNVKVSLPDGRSQQVWIDFSLKDPNGLPIVQVCTPCGNCDKEKYESALKLNMSITYGAIALVELDDTLCFAMVDSYIRETIHPQDLAQSIMSLAKHGDSIEKSLSDKDLY